MAILALEPYYGGSHKIFLDGLQRHIPKQFILLTLPARKWKWRMRLAAPFFADKVIALADSNGIDAILCSSFVDVAVLRSLLPARVNCLPFYSYFHENQFAYPVRKEEERDFHFGLTNLTTLLASDRVAFNTRYNMQTFLAGVREILQKCPDMKFAGMAAKIAARATILNPGLDFSRIDAAPRPEKIEGQAPVIVWNHRWEHDKNPTDFFNILFELAAVGYDFRLIILGQSFRRKPSIFAAARKKLAGKILHWGFVESGAEYGRLLAAGDIVVSTARHEFYGISVIEAVRAGCIPVLPNRLSYPELFPAPYLYGDGELRNRLQVLLADHVQNDRTLTGPMTDRFSWAALQGRYLEWLDSPCR